jgi:hypothetical protein
MAAVVLEIADAMVTALQAATLSMGFTAARDYAPVTEANDLADLRLTVVPRELTLVAASRAKDEFDYVVDVAIQRRVEVDIPTLDPYMRLAEEVLDLFRMQRLSYGTGGDYAQCVAAQHNPIYIPEHLREFRVFTSVVSLTFRTQRAR